MTAYKNKAVQTKMPIPCPAPGCKTTFQDGLDPNALTVLLTLHARTAHPPAAPTQAPAPRAKAEQVKRPTVTGSGTSEEWNYFTQRWTVYKEATQLEGNNLIYQLLECLDEPLRKDITRAYGTLTEETEDVVLNYIKTLAVRPENTMVARVQLQHLCQDRDEPIRAYCARLKGQASVCKFTKKCPCDPPQDVDYSTEIIRDTLIRGIDDDDIRLEIMGQANQEMTLAEVVQFAEAKECGKRSASRLHTDTSTTAAMNSSYRRQNNSQYNQRNTTREPEQRNTTRSFGQRSYTKPFEQRNSNTDGSCGHCGQNGHTSNRQQRFNKCPAYNHRCSRCSSLHHYENMCRKSRNVHNQSQQHEGMIEDTGAIYNVLCSTADIQPPTINYISIDHHIYNELSETWQKKNSEPQPTIKVSIQADPSDIRELGHQASISPTPKVSYPAMTDTGCQSCLSGEDLLHQIGLNSSHLIPVSMKMKAANNEAINIIGALPLRISGVSTNGSTLTTRQLVYFSNLTNKLFSPSKPV